MSGWETFTTKARDRDVTVFVMQAYPNEWDWMVRWDSVTHRNAKGFVPTRLDAIGRALEYALMPKPSSEPVDHAAPQGVQLPQQT